jgi:serine/threonine protein kinase
MVKLYRIQIILSIIEKRVLYFDKESDADKWFFSITQALGQEALKFHDFYDLKLTQENLRGEGSYGKVYVGKCKGSGQDVAIKVIPRTGINIEDMEYIYNEVGILSMMRIECVAQFIDYFEEQDMIYIVQEFINGIHLA